MSDKALKVIEAAESQLGSPYVFGAIGEYCTPKNRERRKRADYPAIVDKCQVLKGSAKSCTGCKYEGDRIFDCRGFTYWLLKQVDIEISSVGATTQYNTAKDWAERGETSQMPNLVCCVFKKKGDKMSHTGMHVGDGKIIHCSGEVKTGSTADKTWTHYAIPKGLYTDEEIREARRLSWRMLKNGAVGADVRAIQEMLNELGYDCGMPDGIFGTKTEAAVKSFQADNGLTVDGIAGERTLSMIAALSAVVGGDDSELATPEPGMTDREMSRDILNELKVLKAFFDQAKGDLDMAMARLDEFIQRREGML